MRIINYKDFDGYVGELYNDEQVCRFEDFLCEYEDDFSEDHPKLINTYSKVFVVKRDLQDFICDECDMRGHEDMYDLLDFNSEKFKLAQKLFNEWIQEQGENLCTFIQSKSVMVDLTELYDKCMGEMD